MALNYFEDGSVDAACPPLKALLHIMAHGQFEGKTLSDPRFRGMFDRNAVLASEWYQERLTTKQKRDIGLWQRHIAALQSFSPEADGAAGVSFDLQERLRNGREQLARVTAAGYLSELRGTIGADPLLASSRALPPQYIRRMTVGASG